MHTKANSSNDTGNKKYTSVQKHIKVLKNLASGEG